jgi:beta-phosphoglucomutase-like phosphatase (HAD superfamily)
MRVIVDVDGTLVDFHNPLHKVLRQRYPDVPKELPMQWNWFSPYMTKEQFYDACDLVHARQMRGHKPLKGAYNLFEMLNHYNAEIIVASARKIDMAPKMANWLQRYHLTPYAGLYTGPDKHFLINKRDIVIDDAPHTIQYCKDVGATCVYLDWPWNDGGFKNLKEVMYEVSTLLEQSDTSGRSE